MGEDDPDMEDDEGQYDEYEEEELTSIGGTEGEGYLTTLLFVVALIIIALVMFGALHS